MIKSLLFCLFPYIGVLFLLFSPLNVNAQSVILERCTFLSGSSTPLSSSNINEGELLFGISRPDGFYRSCVLDQKDFGQDFYNLKGWVWNTNLGWVSLGAFVNEDNFATVEFPSGSAVVGPKTNRTISAGNIAYSSRVIVDTWQPDGNPATGELIGYWWGDNIGWIRLNCAEYYDGEGSYCGSANHSVRFTYNASDKKYDLTGYAYADSVKYINLNGVQLNLIPATKKVSDVKVELTIFNPTENVAIANGTDGYRLRLAFKDKNNTNITETFYNYIKQVNSDSVTTNNISFCLLPTDDRYLDVATVGQTGVIGGQKGTKADCADTSFNRFGIDLAKFNIGPSSATDVNYVFTADKSAIVSNEILRSTVPVSGDGEYVFGSFKISAGNFEAVSAITPPLKVEYKSPFNVKFLQTGQDVSATECSASGLGTFRLTLAVPVALNLCGTFSPISFTNAGPKVSVLPLSEDLNEDLELYFERFVQRSGGGIVSVDLGTGTKSTLIPKTANFSGSDSFVKTFTKPNNSEPTNFVNNVGSNASVAEVEEESEYVVEKYVNRPLVLQWSTGASSVFKSNSFRVVADRAERSEVPSSELLDDVLDLGVKTVLEYKISSTQTVKRNGPVLNQAFFRIDQLNSSGGVDGRAFTQLGSGSGGAGASAKNTVRDNFVKQVFEVVSAGNVKSSCVNPSMTSLTGAKAKVLLSGCKPTATENVYYLTNQTNNRYLISYASLKSFFVDMKQTPKTLVLVGMDVVFNENVLSDTSFPSLVLLTNSQKKGGNVYVTSNVTDLKGYVFADKTIFSVEDAAAASTENVSATGVPLNYGNRNFENFYNEISFIGRFLAQNCIGCSLDNPPKKGDGSIASTIEEAQPYDFNYFRFSSLILETTVDEYGDQLYVACDGTVTGIVRLDPPIKAQEDRFLCWKPKAGVLSSNFMDAKRGEDSSLQTKDRRSVNFVFEQAKLPIFDKI